MTEQVTLDAEFLRRALGREGERADVQVMPGVLPPDFPVTLPELPGLRVLGGVRSAPPGWTFAYPGVPQTVEPVRLQWRVFLDVPAPQGQVMTALWRHFAGEGWQESQLFRRVFVEAARSEWMGTTLEPPRTLGVQARQRGEVTQVDLSVADVVPDHVEHLRGRSPHPRFHDHFEAPLPALTLPEGWRGQMQSGQGGPICSQTWALSPSPDAAPGWSVLLSHLLPQLEGQGWHLLHREDAPESLTVFRTPPGVGTLTLRQDEGRVSALIAHVTAEEGRGGRAVTGIP